jgi:hypothetical protein
MDTGRDVNSARGMDGDKERSRVTDANRDINSDTERDTDRDRDTVNEEMTILKRSYKSLQKTTVNTVKHIYSLKR